MTRTCGYRYAWLFIGCLLASVAQAAEPAATLRVVVDGKPVVFDQAALAGLPHTRVTAAAHDDKPALWSGVGLDELLRRAGAPLDKPLRGRGLARFVRVTAGDHYQAVFGLAELDPSISRTTVLLADARDGQPLTSDGPFRLVVPGDKRPARWVRGVIAIEVVDAGTSGGP
ncbi:molybdopterin-dependent oxidoreductase [Dyella koreensis]|uniref:Molybdopterin-dependent oxidoreductase n=1 Tax=Dyella koreensis TaxID=311235 RepID=A0ABW8K3K6_9GAMM